MRRTTCTPTFKRPILIPADLEPTKEETELAEKLAVDIAGIVAGVADASESGMPDPCSLGGFAHRQLAQMSAVGRDAALRAARTLSPVVGAGRTRRDEIDPELVPAIGNMVRRRLDANRPEIRAAITDVVKQAQSDRLIISRTRVKLSPTGDALGVPHRYLCIDGRVSVRVHWETTEPGASRAYWELRGPAVNGGPGGLKGRGYAGNTHGGGEVGGEFTLDLSRYLPPVLPNPTERYELRFLPLADELTTVQFAERTGHSLAVLALQEPEPPVGVGSWSAPAVIDYGQECRGLGTSFAEPIDYYRKARINVNWFSVDSDQPGPGTEEYHLRAFVVELDTLAGRTLGNFGAFLAVDEGDTSRHMLGWKSYVQALGTPASPLWPKLFLVGLSVLEQDSGDSLDDWNEAVAELAREALLGTLARAIKDHLEEIQEEIDAATDVLAGEVASATVAYLVAFIGATIASTVASVVAFAVALIGAFAAAGASDDVYGSVFVGFALTTNESARIHDGSEPIVTPSRILAGSVAPGTITDDRFELGEVEIQLVNHGPEAAGLSGIVRFGMSMEFYDKVTDYVS